MVRYFSQYRWIGVVGLIAVCAGMMVSLGVPAALAQASNWPMYQHDLQRQGTNPDPAARLTPETASGLQYAWVVNLGAAIVAEPIVVGGVVYVGASDGGFYALQADTGDTIWQTYLGITPSRPGCDPQQLGVGSAALYATLSDGRPVIYVGGVDADTQDPSQAQHLYLYALDARTGDVLWRQSVGNPQEGTYTWSSPFIVNNKLFYGVAAQGDAGSPGLGGATCPFVRGALYAFNPATGDPIQGLAPRAFIDSPLLGGGVFTTPAVDPSTGTMYLTTGSPGPLPPGRDYRDYPEVNALLALDVETLATKARWQLPGPLSGQFDFSSGPILFP